MSVQLEKAVTEVRYLQAGALSGKRAGVFSDPDILSKPFTIFSTDLAFLVCLYQNKM